MALLGLACLTGCGGSSTANSPGVDSVPSVPTTDTSTAAAPDLHKLAQTYLRIVAPANSVVTTFRKKAADWNDNTTNPQAAKEAAPVIAAFEKADNELLRVDWPPATAVDVKALVTADGALIGDLNALENVDLLSAGNWANQFSQDAGKVSAAVNIVRSDLGLPPSHS